MRYRNVCSTHGQTSRVETSSVCHINPPLMGEFEWLLKCLLDLYLRCESALDQIKAHVLE